MACSKEQLEISDGHLCSLCSETYNVPRRLPTCGHTFCENCLLTFVSNLKEKGQLQATFDCPVCEKPHPLQNDGEVTLEWIQAFPLVTDFSGTDEGNCDAASGVSDETVEVKNCSPCEDVNVLTPGEKYCIECQIHMCGACVEAHEKFKALANHKLLDRSEVLECEDIMSDVHKYRKCPSHPDRDVELFCKDNEIFLCLICASTSHKNCQSDVEASKCTQRAENKIGELKTSVEQAHQHLNMLQELACKNNSDVKAWTESAEQDVTDIRNKIVGHLDGIVENVFRSTKQTRQEVEDKSNATKRTIERLHALFDQKMLYVSTINKYGSISEIFMGSDHLKYQIAKLEEEVLMLDTAFQSTDVDLAIVDKLRKLSEQIDSDRMPSISATDKTSNHQPKYSLPQYVFRVGDVEQHSVCFDGGSSILPTFSGISMKEDRLLILSESYHKNLCLYDPDMKTKQTLQTPSYNATSLKNKTRSIAFTCGSSKTISVLNVGLEMKVEKYFDTQYQPKGICSLCDGKVAISWKDPPGFSIADISGTSIKESLYLTHDSGGRKFNSFDNMAVDEPRKLVIQPCIVDNAVYCFDFIGKPVFKYSNGLKDPRGVSVDSSRGSVYVCDYSDACVHQLSVRGQPIAVIRHADFKSSPLDVCYDKKRMCLWVSGRKPDDIIFCLKRV